MVYADEFNTATPSGAEAKSQGDDRIRELKRALNQRLGAFFDNWPEGEPLTITLDKISDLEAFTGLTLIRGIESAKPNPATADFFYALDTDILYINNGDDPAVYEPVGGGGSLGEPVSAKIEKELDQVIPIRTTAQIVDWRAVNGDKVSWDPGGFWDDVDDRLYVPSAGLYLVQLSVNVNGTKNAQVGAQLRLQDPSGAFPPSRTIEDTVHLGHYQEDNLSGGVDSFYIGTFHLTLIEWIPDGGYITAWGRSYGSDSLDSGTALTVTRAELSIIKLSSVPVI